MWLGTKLVFTQAIQTESCRTSLKFNARNNHETAGSVAEKLSYKVLT